MSHARSWRLWAAAAGISILAAATAAAPQQCDRGSDAQIATGGTGEVTIPATTASFSIGIATSAPSSAAAGSANALLSKAVSDALTAAGLGRDEISESRLSVGPRWVYDEATRRQKRVAYEAKNVMQIATAQLGRVGLYIDAALSAGATDASDVSFSANNTDQARREALAAAVAAARGDADSIAKAGGGALGELLLLTTEPDGGRSVMPVQAFAGAAKRTPEPVTSEIVPGEIRVTARILGRWRFVPAPAH